MGLSSRIKTAAKRQLMNIHTDLMYAQKVPIVGSGVRLLLWGALGIDVPQEVKLGAGVRLAHAAYGLVVYHGTSIGNHVVIYQGVTIGLSHMGRDPGNVPIVIEDDVVLCAGAKILSGPEGLTVRRGTVVGANAVLLQSTGEDEVWVGVPAKCVRKRAGERVTSATESR